MVTKVVLAKLSPTMDEGTIVKWSKQEGDPVKVGDVLAEIETDKANMEMEALGEGILRKVLVPAGGKAPVGALIGVIAKADEDISVVLEAAATPSPSVAPAAVATPAPPVAEAGVSATAKAAPAGRVAEPARTSPAAAPAAALPAPPRPRTGPGSRVKASPLARNMAAERKIPIGSIAGSGPGGRVTRRDVESYAGVLAPAVPAAPLAPPSQVPVPSLIPGEEIPVSSMRRTIAKRLAESKFTAPHFYVTVEIDMDAAVALREQLLRIEDVKISFNDLVLKACARALTRFPMVNASWLEDRIATHAEVHLGVAVAIPDGLITPVVRNADRKSIQEISREVKDLAIRAKERRLRPEEFSGSTFTVSNLGMYDVTEFTAIINPPDSAILAVGTVRRIPVVAGDEVRPGHRMRVTLSCDHRVVDGVLGARFLAELRRLLESPIALLV